MQVSGKTHRILTESIVDAFDQSSLTQMLQFAFGERLDVLVGPGRFQTMVFNLVEAFNRRDQAEKLLQAARRFNPTNGKLHLAAQVLGFENSKYATKMYKHLADEFAPVPGMELEKLVRRQVPKLAAKATREQMMRVEGRMCIVEEKKATGYGRTHGTGFLIGPDTVLTNHHVVRGFEEGDSYKRLQVRFDALLQEDGLRAPEEGVVIDLDAIPVFSPNAPKNGVPTAVQLDFAILQLASEAGHDPIGGYAGGGQTQTPRGWFKLPFADPVYEAGDPLIIYQFPGGRELMMAIDTEAVIGLADDGLRLRYRNNTEAGSSGSPVFNFDWELVALHHMGGPGYVTAEYNQGIPIARIKQYLAERDLLNLWGD